MTGDLFASLQPPLEEFQPGAFVLRNFFTQPDEAFVATLDSLLDAAALRHMITPGGFRMSVAMSSCGEYGWVSDRRGYRYESTDPETGRPWPSMPPQWSMLASVAAARCGFTEFLPDACLINSYLPGARMSLHQDRNERDFAQPIVSVSLGLPATFLFGGESRVDKTVRVPLAHADVVVWGGPARLRFHGVLPLKEGRHAVLGSQRINLTFRKVI